MGRHAQTRPRSTGFFVVAGVLATLGAITSPQVLGNNTDPTPSFRQAVLLAVVAILLLGTAFVRCTVGARLVVALLVIVDVAVIVEFVGATSWFST